MKEIRWMKGFFPLMASSLTMAEALLKSSSVASLQYLVWFFSFLAKMYQQTLEELRKSF